MGLGWAAPGEVRPGEVSAETSGAEDGAVLRSETALPSPFRGK